VVSEHFNFLSLQETGSAASEDAAPLNFCNPQLLPEKKEKHHKRHFCRAWHWAAMHLLDKQTTPELHNTMLRQSSLSMQTILS